MSSCETISFLDLANDILGIKNHKDEPINLFEFPFLKKYFQWLSSIEPENVSESIIMYMRTELESCNTIEKKLEILNAGIVLLYVFVQRNWTGSEVPVEKDISVIGSKYKSDILKKLVVDGENVISMVEVPELLYLSEVVLEFACNQFKDLKCNQSIGNIAILPITTKVKGPAPSCTNETDVIDESVYYFRANVFFQTYEIESEANRELIYLNMRTIWYLRSLFIHQQILEELSPQLFNKINLVIEEIRTNINTVPKSTTVALYLEFARIFMYYQYTQKSKSEVQAATEMSGIEVSLSGALGKRTKFQKEDLAQLILKVNIENKEELEVETNKLCSKNPKDLHLDDDVRLDKIKYADVSQNKYPDLNPIQQAVILGNLFQIQKSQPKDSLADEELQPLICCILDQPSMWSIRMATLLLRSKLEGNHKRTIERSMMQVQVLVDSLKDSNTTFKEKISYFFISYLAPKWEIQSTLANILVSLGSIKSALEIYLALQEWESVIFCYNTLQMRHKAQEIIEQELKKEQTPKLWCLLGDATDDPSCYEKAWELSNQKSARAQRHWALFYYYRNKYSECIDHFKKSLEINSLQKELWYRLGYAALMEEQWEISATAYRRYCVLDPECFEAWNNLARCYCEVKQKYRAWKALQEALKVDHSNWKVWDNYMVVSSDLQMFDEVVKSYHEILNLKGKHVDIPILNSLVLGFKNFKENESDEPGNQDSRSKLKTRLLELFGRLTSQVINDGQLWFLYSELVDTDSPESLSKKHQFLLKAFRASINKVDWEKTLETCNKVVYILSKLVEVGLLLNKPDILISCKLAATGAVAKIEKENPNADFCENLERNLEKLEAALDKQ